MDIIRSASRLGTVLGALDAAFFERRPRAVLGLWCGVGLGGVSIEDGGLGLGPRGLGRDVDCMDEGSRLLVNPAKPIFGAV